MASARNQPELSCGLDEAGRGCLAGPVSAAAVILPPEYSLPGLNDSKTLSARQRDILAPKIRQCALAWSVGLVWPPRIDQINILQASLEAMAIAVGNLKISPTKLKIDGNRIIPAQVLASHWRKSHTSSIPNQIAIIAGDRLVPEISAASILAKTFRDKLMASLDKKWPGYGFGRHKGYGTREHLLALRKLGPTRQHRLTFRGVAPEPAARQLSFQDCL